MVLELLINPKSAERSPWEMFFLGAVYATIAILVSMWIFPDNESLVMVFFTVLACSYLVQRTFRLEEKKDQKLKKETSRLREHAKALSFFMFLFLGFTFAFSMLRVLNGKSSSTMSRWRVNDSHFEKITSAMPMAPWRYSRMR